MAQTNEVDIDEIYSNDLAEEKTETDVTSTTNVHGNDVFEREPEKKVFINSTGGIYIKCNEKPATRYWKFYYTSCALYGVIWYITNVINYRGAYVLVNHPFSSLFGMSIQVCFNAFFGSLACMFIPNNKYLVYTISLLINCASCVLIANSIKPISFMQ